jgi:hypothetical protein
MLPSVDGADWAGPKPTGGFDVIRRRLSPTCRMRSNMPHPRVIGRSEDGAELISPRSHERKIANVVITVDSTLDRRKETVNHTGRPILCRLRTVSP